MGRDALIRGLGLVALVLAASGGSARLPRLTVAEVWRQHGALDGQVIRVSGVVLKCERLSCSLRSDLGPDSRGLSLGSSDSFDRAIQSRLGQPVVIEARLNARCLHARADHKSVEHGSPGIIVVCSDRANELVDPRLVPLR